MQMNKVICAIFTICTLFSLAITDVALCQDSLKYNYPEKRLGVGYKMSSPTFGPGFILYYKGLGVEAAYGFARESNPKIDVISELKGSYSTNVSMAFGALKNKRFVQGKEFFSPLVVGMGYNHCIEKDNVKGYSGSGTITGIYYYVGLQMILASSPFRRLGGHIYFGHKKWNYDDSILVKHRAPLEYNYPKFYGSMALYYYFK